MPPAVGLYNPNNNFRRVVFPLPLDPTMAVTLPSGIVIVCDDLVAAGVKATLVGGAFEASELDAKRAIDQASRLAAVV